MSPKIKFRTIKYSHIVKKIAALCAESNYQLDNNYIKLINSRKKTYCKKAKYLAGLLLKNNQIAKKEKLPICQDTGVCVFYAEIGNKVKLDRGIISDAIQEGVANGYKTGYLRKSIVNDPLTRLPNTGDNTPAFIYTEIVLGSKLKIWFLPKGGGSENVTALKFFEPTTDETHIIGYISDTIKSIGSKACPPYKLGVCIGGPADYCVMTSKKILIDEFADKNKRINLLSKKILEKCNNLKIGIQGSGAGDTVIKVNIKLLPVHIAMLPVSISVSCNAVRIGRLEL